MSLKIALERIQKAKKTKTTTLDLSSLELTKIPLELSKLTQLTKLDLSDNKIKEIQELEQFQQLIMLDLSNNKITEIKGLEKLSQLRKLSLSSNKILEIKGLEQFSQLTRLSLSSNQIVEIKGLEKLSQLAEIYLNNNQIIEMKGLEHFSKLIVLDLSNNNIPEMKGLEQLTKLVELNLSSNHISEIKNLEKLTRLVELNLSSCQIIKIEGLEQNYQLTKLNLNDNNISELKGLDQLKQLTKLYVGGNRLVSISGVNQLLNLTTIYLQWNKLTKLNGIANLSQLTTLCLHNNILSEIDDLSQLTQLKTLTLSDNLLTRLPTFLLKLDKNISWMHNMLDGISVGGNPITDPPPEIIKQGNEAIKEYFEQRKKSGEELVNEAKLILLGDGRSGKTSLANRLLGKELPKEADRTQGIDIIIGAYSFPLANGQDFKINIWDFAGQDKYKTLHQLFYTDSSLYVMVAESGNMATDYDDWFQAAELFGEGSPLVLVLNEFKEGIGMGSFDRDYWKKQFPNLLKEVFTVNLGTKQSLSIAEEHIRLLAQALPHTKYPFPSNWVAIRRVLNERRNEQYITLQEYLRICKENNLPERESALILSSVLHKIGDCLHYQKSELLNQFIILKNEWATEAVYKILDDKVVAEKKCGFFDMADVKRIWYSAEYENMRPQLLELMKQFKLAYQLPHKEEFVTPPLLPPASPAGFKWPEGDSLELFIDYDFLPKALLTQFIVTRHADIAEGRTLVWRHGVVLKWEGEALAEVSKTKLEGKDAIYIRAQGKNRKGMMTVILKTFRELHAEYKGIKYKEKVPCICDGCRNKKNKQHYFDFANLQFRFEKGRHEVECDQSLEEVNIMQMLENSFVFERFIDGLSLNLKAEPEKKSDSGIRTLHLFLASSNELAKEREKIEQALGRKNKLLKKQGFEIELSIWEDGKHIGKSIRSQDNYNIEVEQCDLFAMLFYSKVGKYSLEEFELAHSLFKDNAMPRMCIYQKNIDLPKNQSQADAGSRFAFLEKLQELEHFPTLFDNTDMLIRQLEGDIDKLLQDEDFVAQLKAE
jgi:internalin A